MGNKFLLISFKFSKTFTSAAFFFFFFEKPRYYCKKYCESCKEIACGSLEKSLGQAISFLIS